MAAIQQNSDTQTWTKIIGPENSFLRFNFGELWRYRDLIYLFVKRDFISIYKQTVLGPLWHFIQPLFTTAVYVVLSKVASIPNDKSVPTVLFYLSGIILWNYFASCLTKTSATFIGNANIFGKVYFPRLAIPISIIISNLMSFFLQFLLIIPLVIYYHGRVHPHVELLAMPVIVLMIALMGLGFGLIVSAMTIKYRDLVFLVGFGVQLAMYVTPIIYPLSAVPLKYRYLVSFNPMAPVIEFFRYALLGSGTFNAGSILYAASFSLIITVVGILLFNKVEGDFVDTV